MKRLEITVPRNNRDAVDEVVNEFCEDVTYSEVKKEDGKYVKFQMIVEPDDIDELIEKVRHIKEVKSGDLTVEIIEEEAKIEKGKKMKNVSSQLSTQEMYSKALTFSQFDISSWVLIMLSAGIAVFGMMMENVMVVVGAMVIAPLIGPFIASSFGFVIGDRRIIKNSFMNAVFGVAIAILIAFIIPKPGFEEPNALMEMVANPTLIIVPLSIFVGSASALTFVSGNKEQLAGVAVAIALVPPAAVSGISLSIGAISMFLNSLIVILTNMAALILAGSITFKFVGVSPSTYYRKKVSQEKMKQAIMISAVSILLISVFVGYLTFQNIQSTNLRSDIDQVVDSSFSDNILSRDVEISGQQIHIEIMAFNPEVDVEALEDQLEARTGREVSVELIALKAETR